ncbi:hypothetical protein D3C80_1495290 [compost metagenome]
MGSNSLILLRGDFSFPTGVSKVTVTGRFKQYTEQFIDEQLMGKIEELLKRQAGGQMNEQTGAQSEEQSEGPSNGQSDGGITGWVDEQVDSLLNKLLRGLNEANQILIPVVEVETLQQ